MKQLVEVKAVLTESAEYRKMAIESLMAFKGGKITAKEATITYRTLKGVFSSMRTDVMTKAVSLEAQRALGMEQNLLKG